MPKIICMNCGYTHTKEEIKVTKTTISDDKITYPYYDAHCVECGKSLGIPKLVHRNIDSKERAIKEYNYHHKKPYATKHKKPKDIIRAEAERMPNACAIGLFKAIIFGAKFDNENPKYKEDVASFFASQWGKDLCEAIGRDAKQAEAHLDEKLPKEFYNSLKI